MIAFPDTSFLCALYVRQDNSRLVKRLGKLDAGTAAAVLDTLGELLAP